MPPLIPRSPSLKFIFDPDGTATEVDLSCYTVAVEASSDTETIDISTFCNQNASELGKTTESIVVAFLWEEALYDALQPHLGEEFELQYKSNTADTKAIMCRGRYASMPWGRFEPGQKVEVDLPIGVLTTIEYETPS